MEVKNRKTIHVVDVFIMLPIVLVLTMTESSNKRSADMLEDSIID